MTAQLELFTEPTPAIEPPHPAPRTSHTIPPREWLFELTWTVCTPSTDPAQARARFVTKHNRHPEYVFVMDGLLWIGPL